MVVAVWLEKTLADWSAKCSAKRGVSLPLFQAARTPYVGVLIE